MKRSLPFVIVFLAAAIALTSGALLYRAKQAELGRFFVKDSSARDSNSVDEKWAHIRGGKEAKVTLEEFADFQCPPCGTLATTLAHLEQDYGHRLRVIFRQFPLAMHAHAAEAARTAEAAGAQGRFWEMHDLLFRNQALWSNATEVAGIFNKYAFTVGLDVERFQRDLASEEIKARIAADHGQGEARGVASTPTIFINGHAIPPASANEAGLRVALDAALSGNPLPATSTPTPAK